MEIDEVGVPAIVGTVLPQINLGVEEQRKAFRQADLQRRDDAPEIDLGTQEDVVDAR